MRRLDNNYLETVIAVAITTAPISVKRGFRSKLPIVHDEAVKYVAKHVASRISNSSTMVIQTDLVNNTGNNGHAGIWGIDEPDPTED